MFDCHPRLDTRFDKDKKAMNITVTFLVNGQNQEEMIKAANRKAKHNELELVDNIKGAVGLIGNLMTEGLKRRLKFDKHFILQLRTHDENDAELYSKKLGLKD